MGLRKCLICDCDKSSKTLFCESCKNKPLQKKLQAFKMYDEMQRNKTLNKKYKNENKKIKIF
ncbi:hypothetical protein GOV12_02280 [Candidatus Pacearchaeota archaeon]|nr:hypothetical protein [Candidatus Pacearchaeota archaeon]